MTRRRSSVEKRRVVNELVCADKRAYSKGAACEEAARLRSMGEPVQAYRCAADRSHWHVGHTRPAMHRGKIGRRGKVARRKRVAQRRRDRDV